VCCTRLAENTGRKESPKNSPSAHHRTTLSGCILQVRHVSTIGKNVLNSSISSRCLHSMANFGPLTAEICWRVWGNPGNFNGFRVSASLLQRRRSLEANQTLYDVWPSHGLVHYMYIFEYSCPLTKFCHVQSSLCVQVLHSLILAALLHGTPATGVSQTLRRGTRNARNGITEHSQRSPLIFSWAAITLGIGQHCSSVLLWPPYVIGGHYIFGL